MFSIVFVFFVCPRLRVGSQSILNSSHDCAGFPETKCQLHTLSFWSFSSVRSSRLIAEIHRILLSLVSSSVSLPWWVIIAGIQNVATAFPFPVFRPQSTIAQSTIVKWLKWRDLFTFEGRQHGGQRKITWLLSRACKPRIIGNTGRKIGFTNVCESCKYVVNLHYICAVG